MEQQAILVVEDTAAIAEMIVAILNDTPHYRATAVGNGNQALHLLGTVRVDLVLLDINLPGISGVAIHDLLRGRDETATVPILFMTAGDHRAEFARREVRDWLAKPFDLDDLLRRVASLLGAGGNGGLIPVRAR